MVGALASKEIFIGQMGVIYAVHEQDASQTMSLRGHLTADYTPLQGLCIMLFILIAAPCMATLAAVARESGSWKWVALQWGYLFGLAWVLTTAVYQIGHGILHL
jgi:ferrous iron transport protein B